MVPISVEDDGLTVAMAAGAAYAGEEHHWLSVELTGFVGILTPWRAGRPRSKVRQQPSVLDRRESPMPIVTPGWIDIARVADQPRPRCVRRIHAPIVARTSTASVALSR